MSNAARRAAGRAPGGWGRASVSEWRFDPRQPLVRSHPVGIAGLWFSSDLLGGNDSWSSLPA